MSVVPTPHYCSTCATAFPSNQLNCPLYVGLTTQTFLPIRIHPVLHWSWNNIFCKIKMIVIMTILKCCHPCTVSQGMTFFKERDILLTDTYVQVYCLHTYDVIFSFICVVQYFFYYLSILGTHFYLFYANTTLIDAQPHPILFMNNLGTYIYLSNS
jgi:hypothetical protein